MSATNRKGSGQTAHRRRVLWLSLAAVGAATGAAGVVARALSLRGRDATGTPLALAQTGEGGAGAEGISRLRVSTAGWKTDFSRHTVPLGEIMSGGPGKDGIPPIDAPKFVDVPAAARWLKDVEPVIALDVDGAARAYPLQILIWHEIVNDALGGVPVTVTFCPLCNTAIVFDRRLDGLVYDFGVSGNLRHSDLVMWDRQTESWWQQATGECIVGTLAGKRLTMLTASIISWQEFRATWPRGEVLSRETGHNRAYGRNPYVGYDEVGKPPFLYRGPVDGRLPPMERVLLVEIPAGDGGAAGAGISGSPTGAVSAENVARAVYPFSALSRRRVVHDELAGRPLVAFWAPGTTSALDGADIAASRDVGAAAAFAPEIEASPGDAVDGTGRLPSRLTFRPDPRAAGRFVDDQTGSTWSISGRAVAGPLEGRQLRRLLHGNHFWFAAAAFVPEAAIRLV